MANNNNDFILNQELRDTLDRAGVETTMDLPLNVQVPMIGPHTEPIPKDGEIPYLAQDIRNPLGTNNMSSRQLFAEREMYKDVPYFMGLPDPMDSWYDKLYFGRVDRIQNGIILRKNPNNVKEIPSEKGNIFALNFVADAFEGLKRYMRAWGDAGQITTISLYYDLTPVSALENPYRNLDALHRIWSEELAARIVVNKKRDEKTLDFKCYVRELLNYMKTGTTRRPITVTGYIVSNFSSPMNSGLSIQLAQENYGTDAPKFSKYMMDPNFNFFVKAARKFGFYVDRNAPWRIIADPFSTPMLQRMAPYFQAVSFDASTTHAVTTGAMDCLNQAEIDQILGLGGTVPHGEGCAGTTHAPPTTATVPDPPNDLAAAANKFFHHYYRRTYTLEWGIEWPRTSYPYGLQVTLKKMYNDFVEEYPRVKTTTTSTVRCRQRNVADRVKTTVMRKAVTDQDLMDYGNMYWLDLYFKIRLHESGVRFENYDHHVRTFRQIYRLPGQSGGIPSALRYINNEIKPYLYNLKVGAKSLTPDAGPVRIGSVKDY